ncbi:hypothetical protein [Eisenibacter elegans]|uniref:hypothetical protein n=1 Tax=Eisenibacter elegans TaxID=997 RepID=UPI000401885C|nr:hypothetical protein [Eisenibacter elegans]
MNHIIIRLFFCLLIAATTSTAQAQFVTFGFNTQLGVPVGQYARNQDQVGFGFGTKFLVSPFGGFVHFGAELGYQIYNRDVQDYDIGLFGSSTTYKLVNNNNMLMGHLVLRLMPNMPGAIFQPYVDVMGGRRRFYLRTKLQETTTTRVDFDDDETRTRTLSAETNFASSAWSYGGAVGGYLRLGEMVKLDLRLLYLLGSEAEYLNRDGIQQALANPRPDGSADFRRFSVKSATDMYAVQLGLVFTL